jgi:AraC family transcriptional regulator
LKRLLRVVCPILGLFFLVQLGCQKKAEVEKTYEIQAKTAEKMTIAYLEHVGPYDQMGDLFARLGEYAAGKQLGGNVVGIYYDDPENVPAASLRSEIGIVVPEGFEPDSGYKFKELPAQKVAYAVLKGPYAEIANEHPYIYKWIEEKGHKPAGPTREIYLKAGPDVPPDQLITEVQIPITE